MDLDLILTVTKAPASRLWRCYDDIEQMMRVMLQLNLYEAPKFDSTCIQILYNRMGHFRGFQFFISRQLSNGFLQLKVKSDFLQRFDNFKKII